MRRQFKPRVRTGRSVEELYKQDRFERLRKEWIEAQPADFTVQEYEREMRRLRELTGAK